SGNDPTGTMAEVACDVVQRFGPIDFVLSNLRTFAPQNAMYISGGHYWLSLTPDQMRRFHAMADHSLTLGPRGVAEGCDIVGARHYLPYAHWWGEVGGDPFDDERSSVDALEHALGATRIVRWKIGDWFAAT